MKIFIIVLCLLLYPTVSHAVVFWDDEMEDASTRFNASGYLVGSLIPALTMAFDTSVKFSGTGSIRLNYPINCQTVTTANQCGGGAGAPFTPTDNIYQRAYFRMSGSGPNVTSTGLFIPAAAYTKMMKTQNGASFPRTWLGMGQNNTNLVLQAESAPDVGRVQSLFTSISLVSNRWYCIETHHRLNTVTGSTFNPDGIGEVWVDGVLVGRKTDFLFRNAGVANPTALMTEAGIFRQIGNGNIWWDRWATGNTRIGCVGTTPPPDTTAPSIPGTLTLSVAGASSITSAWGASTDASGIDSYEILRCTGAACIPATSLTSVSGTTLSYPDTSVAPSTLYRYQVRAVDASSNRNRSAGGNIAEATSGSTFIELLGSDTFTRADNTDLGATWDAGYTSAGPARITSNAVQPTTLNTEAHESYNAVTPPANQYCEYTLAEFTGAQLAEQGCNLRMANSPTPNWYTFKAVRNGGGVTSAIRKYSGTPANLVTENGTTWAMGDKLRGEAEGTTLRLYRIPFGTTSQILTLTTTDATYASGKTGIYAFVATGGTLSNVRLDDFRMGDFQSGTTSTIAVDAVSVGPVNTTATSFSWPHTVGTGANRAISVCIGARDDTVAGDTAVTSVTIGGLQAIKIRHDVLTSGLTFRTEPWYVVNPPSGVNTINVRMAGIPGGYSTGTAVSYTGVDQVAPLDAHNGSNGTSTTSTVNVTTVANNSMVTDCATTRSNTAYVPSGGLTVQSNRSSLGVNDDNLSVSTFTKTPAGVATMSGTTGTAEAWTISAFSFTPAMATPLVPPVITAFTPSLTGLSGFTYTGSLCCVRVHQYRNDGQINDSAIRDVSLFAGGNYSEVWRAGIDGIGLNPIDTAGVENAAGRLYKPFAVPVDLTPASMTQTLPVGTLNQGTTSTTFALITNKLVNECRWATTNISYAAMVALGAPSLMTGTGTSFSASTGAILSNGTTTHIYQHCMRLSPLDSDVEIPTTTALDTSITVAAGAPTDTTPPSTITDLARQVISQSQINLSWSVATDNVALHATNPYQVYIDPTGTCTGFIELSSSMINSYQASGLAPATTVSFVVRARDTSQILSAANSNCVTATTGPALDTIPPAQAGIVSVQAFRQSVEVTMAPIEDVSPLTLSIELSPVGCMAFAVVPSTQLNGDNVTRLTVGLTPNTYYCIRAKWSDPSGNIGAYSDIVTFRTPVTGLDARRLPIPFGVDRSIGSRLVAGVRIARPPCGED